MIYKLVSIAVLLFCINLNTTTAQVFKGTVVDDETGEPVPFSTIFLTNTTLGVSADGEGRFSMNIPPGYYEVVIRMLGYELMTFTIRTEEMESSYEIRLIPDIKQLGEIKIEGDRDALWYRNLEIFKDYFLGTSDNAKNCIILNPEVMVFDSESEESVLTARAVDVIKIKNPKLGYEIDYILLQFKLDSNSNEVFFKGYPSYKNMPKYESRLPRRIVKNREKAYNGSIHHFLRSVYFDTAEEEGYLIRQVKMVPNPERPSDELIANAKKKMNEIKDFAEKESLYRNYVSKERLAKFISEGDSTYSDSEVFTRKTQDGQLLFQFEDLLEVTYTKEKTEPAYWGNPHYAYPKFQMSLLRMTVPYTIINHQGVTYNPFDIFLLGYMGWEKMGDMMPIDYIP